MKLLIWPSPFPTCATFAGFLLGPSRNDTQQVCPEEGGNKLSHTAMLSKCAILDLVCSAIRSPMNSYISNLKRRISKRSTLERMNIEENRVSADSHLSIASASDSGVCSPKKTPVANSGGGELSWVSPITV